MSEPKPQPSNTKLWSVIGTILSAIMFFVVIGSNILNRGASEGVLQEKIRSMAVSVSDLTNRTSIVEKDISSIETSLRFLVSNQKAHLNLAHKYSQQ